MRKFWLVFSQAVTVCLAILFVIITGFIPATLGAFGLFWQRYTTSFLTNPLDPPFDWYKCFPKRHRFHLLYSHQLMDSKAYGSIPSQTDSFFPQVTGFTARLCRNYRVKAR